MKTQQISKKYIEWHSPAELHDTALNWISELKFIKDEQHFMDELIENHTLQMIEKNTFKTSTKIVGDLSKKRKQLESFLKKVIVHYRNGSSEEIALRANIPAGGETRAIDLNGKNRIIKKVVFYYNSKPRALRKGKVKLFGMH